MQKILKIIPPLLGLCGSGTANSQNGIDLRDILKVEISCDDQEVTECLRGKADGTDTLCFESLKYRCAQLARKHSGDPVATGYLKRACQLENGAACYENGQNLEKLGQFAAAKLNYVFACQSDEVRGCYRVGQLMAKEQKSEDAKVFFSIGCMKQHQPSCFTLNRKLPQPRVKPAIRGILPAGVLSAERSSPKVIADSSEEELPRFGPSDFKFTGDGYDVDCQQRAPSACFKKGVTLMRRGQSHQALKHFLNSCADGFPYACNRVGWLALNAGQEILAQDFFVEACAKGDGKGCNNLGWLFEKGGDGIRAREHYLKACQVNHRGGCANKIRLESRAQRIVTVSDRLPARKNRDLCHGKTAASCFEMGNEVRKKKGIDTALDFFREGCAMDHGLSCNRAGWYLAKQRGSDGRSQRSYFAKACALGIPKGCNNLGLEYERLEDFAEAKRLYAKACKAKHGVGCRNLNRLTLQAPKTILAAVDGNRGPAHSGNICQPFVARTCLQQTSIMRIQGRAEAAKDALFKACGLNHSAACFQLGRFELADGNLDLAQQHLSVACKGNLKAACFKLVDMGLSHGILSSVRHVLESVCRTGKASHCLPLARLNRKVIGL